MNDARPVSGARPPDSVPIEHDWIERIVQSFAMGAPLVALIVAGWLAWGGMLRWQDLGVMAIVYFFTGHGRLSSAV